MFEWLTRNKYIVAILLLGLVLRVVVVPYLSEFSGDLALFMDWGKKFWELGASAFYAHRDWYYAPPNYPPLINLLYAGAYWAYDNRYVLSQIHNATRLVPSFFIIFFGDWGYQLMIKLPAVLADIGLAYLIYRIVKNFKKSERLALFASAFYLFNPVSIILSAIWGQSDSFVAIFAICSFLLLLTKRPYLSPPLYFLSLYTKPNWAIFIPLYLAIVVIKKVRLKDLVVGGVISLVLLVIITYPFAPGNLIGFTVWLARERVLPTLNASNKASVSAFNLYTVLYYYDKTGANVPLLGIPIDILGKTIFGSIYVYSIYYLSKKRANLKSVLASIFFVAFGSFLFLTGMLERYFFPGFVPMVILMFADIKLLKWGIILNIAVFVNIFYALFRRKFDAMATLFNTNDFLLVRSASIVNVASWLVLLKKLKR